MMLVTAGNTQAIACNRNAEGGVRAHRDLHRPIWREVKALGVVWLSRSGFPCRIQPMPHHKSLPVSGHEPIESP